MGRYHELVRVWGTTPDERGQSFPCDRVLPDHDVAYFRGITVDTPPAVIFAWLCQLRVATYSYDWISHLGRRSPQELDPALQALAVGQPFMDIFDVVDFERDRHVTLRLRRPGPYPPLAVSYMIVPQARDRCRLLVKLVVSYRRTFIDGVVRLLAPWLDWVMMRRQLLNLKALAERTPRGSLSG